MTRTIDVVSMGCFKNLVDSERLLARLDAAGLKARHNPDEELEPRQYVVINTCGFIQDAKQESIDMILRYAQSKRLTGRPERLYVMGCLSERYRQELPEALPEVDGWYGKYDWDAILDDINAHPSRDVAGYERRLTTLPHYAYVKISEGCNRCCAFCAIPLITGPMHSCPIDEIIAEVHSLVSKGVKEFNVIAQDLSGYGTDIYPKGEHSPLYRLIDEMSKVEGVSWIRLHYFYPAGFPYDVLDLMATRPNVCRYIDIALQHIDDGVLSNMRRHITAEQTNQLIGTIRDRVPGVHIRTTVMTGFPGETPEAFDRLLQWVKDTRFERLGGFTYSEEDDTYGAKHLDDNIPQEVKQPRLDRIMETQEDIALSINEAKVGQEIRVIVDREEPEYYICRSEFDSPEVDPEILVHKTRPMKIGEFYTVRITEAMPYELIAQPC